MVLPAAWLMAPPAVVVNEKVTETDGLAATRSFKATENVGLSTLSPIGPDVTVAHVPSFVVLIFTSPSTPVGAMLLR